MTEPAITEVNLLQVEGCGYGDGWIIEAFDEEGSIFRAEFYSRNAERDVRRWAALAYPECGFSVVTGPKRREPRQRPKLTIVGGTALGEQPL